MQKKSKKNTQRVSGSVRWERSVEQFILQPKVEEWKGDSNETGKGNQITAWQDSNGIKPHINSVKFLKNINQT